MLVGPRCSHQNRMWWIRQCTPVVRSTERLTVEACRWRSSSSGLGVPVGLCGQVAGEIAALLAERIDTEVCCPRHEVVRMFAESGLLGREALAGGTQRSAPSHWLHLDSVVRAADRRDRLQELADFAGIEPGRISIDDRAPRRFSGGLHQVVPPIAVAMAGRGGESATSVERRDQTERPRSKDIPNTRVLDTATRGSAAIDGSAAWRRAPEHERGDLGGWRGTTVQRFCPETRANDRPPHSAESARMRSDIDARYTECLERPLPLIPR